MNESILQAFLFLTSRESNDEQIYRILGFHTTKPIQSYIFCNMCVYPSIEILDAVGKRSKGTRTSDLPPESNSSLPLLVFGFARGNYLTE